MHGEEEVEGEVQCCHSNSSFDVSAAFVEQTKSRGTEQEGGRGEVREKRSDEG